MKEFYALRIAGDDGYFGHFGDEGQPIPVLIHHALLYKDPGSFKALEVEGTVVKVTLTITEVGA